MADDLHEPEDDKDSNDEKDGADGEQEPQKGYRQILEHEIETGLAELERPARGLFLSALSAVLAGWLLGLLAWLVSASRDTTGEILIVALVTTAIGIADQHHCVVGSAEVLAGVSSAQGGSLAGFARFLALATLGNVVGAVVFVALIKYGHATRTAERA